MPSIRNIIFDLGGVLLRIDFAHMEKVFARLGVADFGRYYNQHEASEVFTRLETGRISPNAFADALRRMTGKPLTNRQIEEAWTSMILDFPEGIVGLLQRLQQRYRLFLFSNTNIIHVPVFEHKLTGLGVASPDELFEAVYYSHELGLRKPDPEAFEEVLRRSGLQASETVFIDDTIGNIRGAASVGLHTILLSAPRTLADLVEGDILKEDLMDKDR